MDRKTALIAFIALAILIWLGRKRLLDIVTKSGGFELVAGPVDTVSLPEIKMPALPNYKPGPETWEQTTGLMCACNLSDYTAPIVVQTITVPEPPGPKYVYTPPAIAQVAATPPLYYSSFGIDSSFPIWGNQPYESAWLGSDGRLFLKRPSNNPSFIGSQEYHWEGQDIIYGPYRYKPQQSQFMARSA
jgi:hypothetical protein